MPREADNHIRVTDETWSRLNNRKRPGDSFNDVIERILDESEGAEAGNPKPTVAMADD